MSEPSFEFGNQWKARCFVCGESYGQYQTGHRLCEKCVEQYKQHSFFRDVSELSSCFATILPEVEGVKEEVLYSGFRDLLLGYRHDGVNENPRALLEKVFSRELLLPCGQPALFEMEHLAKFSGFGGVWTLDLSPYIWSGTLKDLRSWAVLSLAIEHKIKHLSLWTAGNAGFSLAKLVHRWNATVDETERKTVYCMVDASAPPEIVVMLRSLQCRVAPIATGSGAILSREQLYHVFVALSNEQEHYWQVTDGWDGVGVFMYSLLAQQCLHFLRKELEQNATLKDADVYVILPLGTGNFLLGVIRGMERFGQGRAKVVAALPHGDHMMVPFFPKKGEPNGRPRMRPDEPEAPKLTGFYSPLSPCLYSLVANQKFQDVSAVEFIEVDRASQIEAAARVLSPANPTIASEPSALIAFGALKQLVQRIRNYGQKPEKSVALVVNSGFGLMGAKEQEFYTKSIFAFR